MSNARVMLICLASLMGVSAAADTISSGVSAIPASLSTAPTVDFVVFKVITLPSSVTVTSQLAAATNVIKVTAIIRVTIVPVIKACGGQMFQIPFV